METAWELFVHELRDALNFENKLVHVLGEQALETRNEQLREAFNQHRHQTEQHAARLVEVFRELGEVPEQADCKGVDGLAEEKLETMKHHPGKDLLDFINVGAGIKAERYEISSYETLLVLAEELRAKRCAELLKQNLREEKETLEILERFANKVKPTNLGIKESPEGGIPRKAA